MATVAPRALVVEDNRVMADVVRFNLSRAGMDVEVAFNGRAALDAFNAAEFDLVITDYQMPEMSGEELCPGDSRRQPQHSGPDPARFCQGLRTGHRKSGSAVLPVPGAVQTVQSPRHRRDPHVRWSRPWPARALRSSRSRRCCVGRVHGPDPAVRRSPYAAPAAPA